MPRLLVATAGEPTIEVAALPRGTRWRDPMLTNGPSRTALLAPALFGLALLAGPGAALAGDCNADIAALTQKRQAFIDKLNVLAKATKGKLDPVASCPQLRGLTVAEGNLLKYLQANKNWCNIPDEAVDNLKGASAKSQSFATQACNIATQAKKQQAQQAASGLLEAQKLPSGPL
jgi:hypothetical protein